jgi:tRNA threonylcarbamoyladenosine biosynthesis protein TsaB
VPPGRYVAVLDAMRGDVFACVFSVTDRAITTESPTTLLARAALAEFAREHAARPVGPTEQLIVVPHARGVAKLGGLAKWPAAADLGTWEPNYGRLAEAQVKWEAAHGRALTIG